MSQPIVGLVSVTDPRPTALAREREEYYDQPLVDFAELMSSADLEGLAMETRVVAGAGHASTVMEGYTRGYMFVFGEEP